MSDLADFGDGFAHVGRAIDGGAGHNDVRAGLAGSLRRQYRTTVSASRDSARTHLGCLRVQPAVHLHASVMCRTRVGTPLFCLP